MSGRIGVAPDADGSVPTGKGNAGPGGTAVGGIAAVGSGGIAVVFGIVGTVGVVAAGIVGAEGTAGATGPPIGGAPPPVGRGTTAGLAGELTPPLIPGTGTTGLAGVVVTRGKLDGGLTGSTVTLGGGMAPVGAGNIAGVVGSGGVATCACASMLSRFGGGIVPLAGITPLGGWLF
jgi:hypothetical protein